MPYYYKDKDQVFGPAEFEMLYAWAQQGELPVLITSPSIRPHVRSIIERFRGQTPVMSQNEVHPRARLKTLGTI